MQGAERLMHLMAGFAIGQQRLQGGGGWYQQRQSMYGYPSSVGGDWCMKLCIANMMCNLCCGGSGLCCGGYSGGGYGGYI